MINLKNPFLNTHGISYLGKSHSDFNFVYLNFLLNMICDQYSILITGGRFYWFSCMLSITKKGFNIISLDSLIKSSHKVSNNIRNLLEYEKVNLNNRFTFIKGY